MPPAPELTLAAQIVDIARELTRTVPPPRGAPYFCLDDDAPYDLGVLGGFSERGIFRKYEFALDFGSGLGGRARWLAARSGCRILGVDPRPPMVAAAALLNRRARMDEQVAFQVGEFGCLPLRARVFTHVWMVDLAEEARTIAAYREGFRVLRPGGHFAMQCAEPAPAARDAVLETLTAVGFVNLELRHVECTELSPPCRLARDRLRAAAQRFTRVPRVLPAATVQIFATRRA